MAEDSVEHMPEKGSGTWVFDAEVAGVFDDMLDRSVPGYAQVMDLIAAICDTRLPKAAKIIDLGCSTAKAFSKIHARCPNHRFSYVGVDEAQPMLDKAKENFPLGVYKPAEILSFTRGLSIYEPTAVILSITLQFIPVEHRMEIIANIYKNLPDGGLLFFFEKCLGDDNLQEALWTDLYYERKHKQGYSWDSIMQKRESLENVLVPLTVEWNRELLEREGFRVVPMSSWCNFHFMLGIKGEPR